MITSHYVIDHYTEPNSTYTILSNKIKLGQLVFNIQEKAFEIVNLKVLKAIVAFEKGNGVDRIYYPIPLNPKWLTKVFHFEVKRLNVHYMHVFTSKVHGLKIHGQHNRYYIAYTIREKVTLANQMKGVQVAKPQILYVHELMDQLYLLKREQIEIKESDLANINKCFSEELKKD
tara:strand:- start:466 stop:987 length:522 start_codon:yes stop_codon:yes gene_type:complete